MMKNKEPILSICVPTYNRGIYLKELLDSIVCQKEFVDTDNIEIVVDDWPSTDNTKAIVNEYIKKYWNKIKYYRNPVRIWMCPAFLEAFFLWKWEYCWIFSSDDFMTERTLEITLNIIKRESPSLIFWRERTKWKTKDEGGDLIKLFDWMSDFSIYLWEKWWEK